MSEEVKQPKKPYIVSAADALLTMMITPSGTDKLSVPTVWKTTLPPVNAAGNASGMRMFMVIMISRFAAIAIITATPDAAVVMLFCTRTMPIIWTVKHTAVTVTRTNERKAI